MYNTRVLRNKIRGVGRVGLKKKWLSAVALCFMVFSLLGNGVSEAAVPGNGIPKVIGEDSIYLHAKLDDAGEIARRLSQSEFARAFASIAKIDGLTHALRRTPVTRGAFFVELVESVFSLRGGVILAFQPDKRDILKRIEAETATSRDFSELFPSEILSQIAIESPKKAGKGYELASLGVTIQAKDGLLIATNAIEDVTSALSHSSAREKLPQKMIGNNVFVGRIPSALVAMIFRDELRGLADTEKKPQPLNLKVGLELVNAGWNLEVDTNAVRLLTEMKWQDYLRPLNEQYSFSALGRGETVAGMAWRPNMYSIGLVLQKVFPKKISGDTPQSNKIAQEWKLLFKEKGTQQLPDVVNVAIVKTEENPVQLAPYVVFRGGNTHIAELVQKTLQTYAAENKSISLRKGNVDGWNFVYEIATSKGAFNKTIAARDGLIVAGLMSADVLLAPAQPLPMKLQQLVGNNSLYEFGYVNVPPIRTFVWQWLKSDAIAKRSAMRKRELSLIPLQMASDLETITFETRSPENFVFRVKTGRPSREEWFRLRGLSL